MTKTDLIFPAFSSIFLNFAAQFCFRCKFSFHEERLSSQVWHWVACFSSTNHNCLLCRVIDEIASFCIDNRSCQMAFFRFRQSGQRRGKDRLSRYVEIFWNKKGVWLLYKTNRFHVALRLFSNRSQKKSKCGKKIRDTLRLRLTCHFFCSYQILMSSVIHYWTDARQHEIYLLNRNTSGSLGEHREPQASFSTAFRILPDFHECFYNSIETRSTCFLFLFFNL